MSMADDSSASSRVDRVADAAAVPLHRTQHPRGPSPNPPRKQRPRHHARDVVRPPSPPPPASVVATTRATPRLVPRPLSPPPEARHQSRRRPGRRSATLRLLEEVPPSPSSRPHSPLPPSSSAGAGAAAPFRSLARLRSRGGPPPLWPDGGRGGGMRRGGGVVRRAAPPAAADRGAIVVSWYEGTTSAEMREHVLGCVRRKLRVDGTVRLEDVRLLDEGATPHEEVVLCPYLPDGSHFLLKFKTSVERPPATPKPNRRPAYTSRAPDSPSAEPVRLPHSPSWDHRGTDRMQQRRDQLRHAQQMRLLKTVAALLERRQRRPGGREGTPPVPLLGRVETVPKGFPAGSEVEGASEGDRTPNASASGGGGASEVRTGGGATPKRAAVAAEDRTTDQLIERHLSQLIGLMARQRSQAGAAGGGVPSSGDGGAAGAASMADGVTMNGTVGGPPAIDAAGEQRRRTSRPSSASSPEEKRQVIFVISNYLVLFMGFVALSVEIQSRLPRWMRWVQRNYDSVRNCSTDRDALVECLSDGDLAGLAASFLLWATQSASAKRVFLFGFDTPKKLWTVVYEALVSAACSGTSYLFLRRGLNPTTRENFLHRYWKDAVYGSLAGFCAAFMKAVLKNLVPQDVAFEALEGGRPLRIFHWLGSLLYDEELI